MCVCAFDAPITKILWTNEWISLFHQIICHVLCFFFYLRMRLRYIIGQPSNSRVKLRQTTTELGKRTGFDDVGQPLGLTTRAQINAAFIPDRCSPDTSWCIHLYRLSPFTCILYRRQNWRHGYMYPLVSASRTLLRTCIRLVVHCIRRHVDGYKLLVRDTCIRLHVSGGNAA